MFSAQIVSISVTLFVIKAISIKIPRRRKLESSVEGGVSMSE
jgi:hypothetical protein